MEKSAAEAISGLTLTAENYTEAVAILKKRFGNKQQIITKHMDTLLKLDAVPSQHNLKAIRHMYDLVETHVRGLKSLGVNSDSYGSLLLSVLIQKIPPELQLILSREIGGDNWDLDDLLKRLQDEIAARERIGTPAPPSLPNSQPMKKSGRGSPNGTAATLFASSNSSSCCYCQGSHPSGRCEAITDVKQRTKILMKAGRCFVCLRKYHIS